MALFKARQKQVKLDEGGDNALENGAIVYYFPSKSAHTTQNIKKICRSLRHLYHHFNNHAMYPVYIFMDQFSRDIQTELLMELTFPSSNELNHLDRLKNAHSISFFPINLDVPNSEIHPKPLYTKNYPADNNLDLLYFGNLYNHPVLDEIRYVWSMGMENVIQETLQYDPLEVMKTKKLVYGFRNESVTKYDRAILLWDLVEEAGGIHGLKRFNKNGYKIPSRRKRNSAGMLNYDTRFEFVHVPTFRRMFSSSPFVKKILDSKGKFCDIAYIKGDFNSTQCEISKDYMESSEKYRKMLEAYKSEEKSVDPPAFQQEAPRKNDREGTVHRRRTEKPDLGRKRSVGNKDELQPQDETLKEESVRGKMENLNRDDNQKPQFSGPVQDVQKTHEAVKDAAGIHGQKLRDDGITAAQLENHTPEKRKGQFSENMKASQLDDSRKNQKLDIYTNSDIAADQAEARLNPGLSQQKALDHKYPEQAQNYLGIKKQQLVEEGHQQRVLEETRSDHDSGLKKQVPERQDVLSDIGRDPMLKLSNQIGNKDLTDDRNINSRELLSNRQMSGQSLDQSLLSQKQAGELRTGRPAQLQVNDIPQKSEKQNLVPDALDIHKDILDSNINAQKTTGQVSNLNERAKQELGSNLKQQSIPAGTKANLPKNNLNEQGSVRGLNQQRIHELNDVQHIVVDTEAQNMATSTDNQSLERVGVEHPAANRDPISDIQPQDLANADFHPDELSQEAEDDRSSERVTFGRIQNPRIAAKQLEIVEPLLIEKDLNHRDSPEIRPPLKINEQVANLQSRNIADPAQHSKLGEMVGIRLETVQDAERELSLSLNEAGDAPLGNLQERRKFEIPETRRDEMDVEFAQQSTNQHIDDNQIEESEQAVQVIEDTSGLHKPFVQVRGRKRSPEGL